MASVYEGLKVRTTNDFIVYKNGEILDPAKSQKVRHHSPDGFSWGYGGSGPAQLALALLLEEIPQGLAIKNYQKFKRRVVAAWDVNGNWSITSRHIKDHVAVILSKD